MSESAGFFYPNEERKNRLSSTIKTSEMADEEEELVEYDPFERLESSSSNNIHSGDRVRGQYVSYTTFNPIHEEFISDDPVRHYNKNHPPYAPGKLSDNEVRSLYNFERERMENIKMLRESPEYRFFELVAGTMSRYPKDILQSSYENHQKAYTKLTGTSDLGGGIPTVYPMVPPTPYSESSITSVKRNISGVMDSNNNSSGGGGGGGIEEKGNLTSGAPPPIGEDFVPRPLHPKEFRDERIRNTYEGQIYNSVIQRSHEKEREKEMDERRGLMLLEKRRLENLLHSGIINQNPAIYQATLQAKMLLDTRVPRLSGTLVDKHYIRCKNQSIVSQFANLTGNVALKAGIKNPTQWHLQATYTRVEIEIERIIRWFQSNVYFNGTSLVFTRGSHAPRGAEGISSLYRRRSMGFGYQKGRLGYLSEMKKNPVHDLGW